MKSLTAELAALEGRLPAYPEPPPISALAQEIAVFVGRRSDQTERSTNPSSVFEMELDAEVQGLNRQYEDLQTTVYDYLARHRAVAKLRARIASAVVGLTIALCVLVTWSALPQKPNPGLAEPLALDTAPTSKVRSLPLSNDKIAAETPMPAATPTPDTALATTPSQTAIGPMPPPSSPLISQVIAPTSVLANRPQTPAAPPLTNAPVQATSAEKSGTSQPKQSVTKEAAIFAVEDSPPAKADKQENEHKPSQPAKTGDTSPVKRVVDPVSIKSQPVAKVVTKPTRSDAASERSNKGGAEEGKRADETKSKATSNGLASASTDAGPKPDDDSAEKPSRKDQYGSSGVVTIMPSGVVVFDVKTKSQKLVPIGSKLPDGSILKGVDAKASRIKTDKGEVEYE